MHKSFSHGMRIALVLCVLASAVAACSPGPRVVKAETAQSDKARQAAQSPEQARVPELVTGNTQFAMDLYHVLYNQGENLFYSPYSISLALAMAYAGARGLTEQQMAQALHFDLPQTALHAAFNSLEQALASRGQQIKENERFRLHIVNALWGQRDYVFLPAYLDLLAENYGAGMRLLDFQAASEPARETINQWVAEQTEQRIKDLLPSGSINELTRLVLSNAIYFSAAWQRPFQSDNTQDGAFHLLDGTQITVPLMEQTTNLGYYEGDGVQVVELPYEGNELSMLILLPATDRFENVAQALNAQQLQTIVQEMVWDDVHLRMPKFGFEASIALKSALTKLGISDAFGGTADFSGMDGKKDLFVSDVYHKAFIKIDEAGTEAAAATAVVMRLTAAPAEPKVTEVIVDHSFLFAIRDNQSGTILFLGQVVNPSK
jgi:serpin B